MKITINFKSKVSQSLLVPFFKAKKTYLQPNFGMPVFLELSVTSIDDEYIEKLGETTTISEFLMDCIHYDLRVVSINGEPLKNKKDEEIIINPYNEEYNLAINSDRSIISGMNLMEIELVNVDDLKKSKSNRKLLLS
jgi:hypothetical protein